MKLEQVLTYQKGKAPQKNIKLEELILYLTPEYLRGKSEPNYVVDFPSKVSVKDTDLLLLWDGSNAGEFFKGKNGFLSSTMVKFFFDEEIYDRDFLYYQLKNSEYFLKSQTSGSGIPHVDKNVLYNLDIEKIDKPEQTRIAEILSTADKAIEQTEKLIAKYQRIKTGLMQDLLTKGIDEHGNIRSKATHKFVVKKGIEVPEEWEVETINNLATEVLDFKANGSFKTLTENVKYYYNPNYARLIRLVDLRNELKNQGVYIDQKGFRFLKKTRLAEGDILISCVGEYTGYVCQMPKVNYQATIAPNMFVIRFKENCDNSFIAKFMTSSYFQNQILFVSTSSATKLLNNPNLRSLKIVLPPKTEQIIISKKLNSIEETINKYKANQTKLNSIKTGLMQDLLNGRVRVKVKEN